MGAHPPSIRPLFPDHKTETNGHQCCDFKGRSNLPIRLNGGRDGKLLTKNQGVLGCHKKTLATEGGSFWWIFCGVVRKNYVYIFFHTFFLIAISSADICHLQSESLLTVWILICCPPGDTVINHGRVIYLSLLIRCPKVRCHAPKVVATTLHDFTCFP